MIDFSFHPEDPSAPPPTAADPAYWRRAIRRHRDPTATTPVTPPPPPRCRWCRRVRPCAVRQRAERAFIGVLRERRRDGGGEEDRGAAGAVG